jgi:mono/diheme cytochrome c family protein
MSIRSLAVVAVGALGLSCAAFAAPAGKYDLGKYEYQAKCASCHGVSGKGDGPAAKALKKAPPDLTTYAKRNGGAFPTEIAWLVIDGRPIESGVHGSREMPVWGQDFRREVLRPEPGPTPEWYVAGKIQALIDYLNSIQVK